MSKAARKILFDANSLMVNRTGVGYYTEQLIDALAAAHPETEFAGYFYNFLGRKHKPATPVATNISYRPIYHFPGPIINLLRRFRIEVPIELLTFTHADFVLYVNFLNQPSLLKIPSATVIHDLTYVDLPEYVARKNLSDLRRFIPSQLKRSSFIITVSHFAKKRIHETFKYPLDNVLVTHIPPVTPSHYTAEKRTAILSDLGIHEPYFLTLSTIEPRKNVLGMLDAYYQLPEALQQRYCLVITGATGWNCEEELARLDQAKREGKNILRLDYVTTEQRAALYQGATFYTSASHYEGFGMTPLEAMSYGKACALSDIPVFQEIAHDAAIYFNKDNSMSIATSWQKLLEDSDYRTQMSKKAKAQADTYHWDTIAGSVYDRIITTMER